MSSRSPGLRLPSPEESKRLAMPRDDGLGPDDDQPLSPRGKAVKDEGPEGSVPRSEGKTGGPRPQEDAELMPQSEVLGRHPSPRAEQGDEGLQKESNQDEHAERIRAENEPEEGRSGERRNLNRLRHVRPHSDTLWDSGEAQLRTSPSPPPGGAFRRPLPARRGRYPGPPSAPGGRAPRTCRRWSPSNP